MSVYKIDVDFLTMGYAGVEAIVAEWAADYAQGVAVSVVTTNGPAGMPVVRLETDDVDALERTLFVYAGDDDEVAWMIDEAFANGRA